MPQRSPGGPAGPPPLGFGGLSDRDLNASAYGDFGGRDPIRSRSTAGHACRSCHRRVRLARIADGCYIFNTIICALGGADPKLQAIGDAGIGGRPGDGLLHEPMGRAEDLLGGIPEQSLATQDRYVLPGSGLLGLAHDGAAALTVRTAAAVFEGLDPEMEFRIALLK